MAERSEGSGLFIAFEGVDGAGTTTQAELLIKWLNARGRSVLLTREPTDLPIGAVIRAILEGRLVNPGDDGARKGTDPAVIALLFAADRMDHVSQEMLPALEAGTDVVTDRYVYSSLAYQSVELPLEWVHTINKRALEPDITFYLRVSLEVAMERIEERQGGTRDLYENRPMLEAVSTGYENLFRDGGVPGAVILDGALSIEEIALQIQEILRERISVGE